MVINSRSPEKSGGRFDSSNRELADMVRNILFFFSFFLLPFPAYADCTGPAGVNSQTRYDFALHKMFYCDGNDWIGIPDEGGGLGCVLDGVVVPDGGSFDFYSTQNHANCASVRQSRACTNGNLGGTASRRLTRRIAGKAPSGRSAPVTERFISECSAAAGVISGRRIHRQVSPSPAEAQIHPKARPTGRPIRTRL